VRAVIKYNLKFLRFIYGESEHEVSACKLHRIAAATGLSLRGSERAFSRDLALVERSYNESKLIAFAEINTRDVEWITRFLKLARALLEGIPDPLSSRDHRTTLLEVAAGNSSYHAALSAREHSLSDVSQMPGELRASAENIARVHARIREHGSMSEAVERLRRDLIVVLEFTSEWSTQVASQQPILIRDLSKQNETATGVLIEIYEEYFGRAFRVSRDPITGRPRGPGVRFLTTALRELKVTTASGEELSPETLVSWHKRRVKWE
jgi:hypothetical protein